MEKLIESEVELQVFSITQMTILNKANSNYEIESCNFKRGDFPVN